MPGFCYFDIYDAFLFCFVFLNKQDYNHLFYLYGVFQSIQTEKYIKKNSNKNTIKGNKNVRIRSRSEQVSPGWSSLRCV